MYLIIWGPHSFFFLNIYHIEDVLFYFSAIICMSTIFVHVSINPESL